MLVARVQSAVDEDVLVRIGTGALRTGVHLALRTDDARAGVATAPSRLCTRGAMCGTDVGLLCEVERRGRATADPRIDGWHLVQTGWVTEWSQIRS